MKHFKSITAIILSLMLLGCNQEINEPSTNVNKEEVSAALINEWDNLILAFSNGDIDRTMSYYDIDNYINMPSYGVTQNYQQTKEMLQNMFNNFEIKISDFQQIEVFAYEDMAYEICSYNMDLINNTSGDTIPNNARCFTVWKKTDEGKWIIQRWLAQ